MVAMTNACGSSSIEPFTKETIWQYSWIVASTRSLFSSLLWGCQTIHAQRVFQLRLKRSFFSILHCWIVDFFSKVLCNYYSYIMGTLTAFITQKVIKAWNGLAQVTETWHVPTNIALYLLLPDTWNVTWVLLGKQHCFALRLNFYQIPSGEVAVDFEYFWRPDIGRCRCRAADIFPMRSKIQHNGVRKEYLLYIWYKLERW